MNWFSSIYLSWLSSDAWQDIAFDFEWLLFVLLGTLLLSIVKPNYDYKHWLMTVMALVSASFLPIMSDMPLFNWVENGRLKLLSGDSVKYILFAVTGLVSFVYLVTRKRKNIDGIISSFSIFMIVFLGYAYHLVMINGSLKHELLGFERQLSYVNDAEDPFRSKWCNDWELICLEGNIEEFKYTGITHINEELDDYLNFYRSKTDRFGFTISRSLITTEVPFALAYYEDKGRYKYTVDIHQPMLSFERYRLQFFLFLNAAALFWTILPLIVIAGHRRMIKKARS